MVCDRKNMLRSVQRCAMIEQERYDKWQNRKYKVMSNSTYNVVSKSGLTTGPT